MFFAIKKLYNHNARLSLSRSLYASAHFGKSLFWYGSETLFVFLMTERVGLSAMDAGGIFSAGLLLSAVIDIVIGSLINSRVRTVITAGRMQFFGAFATSIAASFLFSMRGTASAGSVGVALIFALSFRIAYAFVDIPQNVLLAIGGVNDSARAKLASWRLAASGLASLAVALVGSTVVFHRHNLMQPLIFALVIGGIATLFCGLLYLNGTKVDENVEQRGSAALIEKPKSWLELRRVRFFLYCVFLSSLSAPVFTKLLPYFALFQVGEPIWGASLMVAVSIGMVIGQFLWIRVLPFAKWSDRLIIASCALCGSATLFGISGVLAPHGLPVIALLFGVSSGGLGSALWGGYATMVSEVCPGREAVAFGTFTAVSKISNALGALGLGVLLSSSSFRVAGNSRLLVTMMLFPLVAGLMISGAALLERRSEHSLAEQADMPKRLQGPHSSLRSVNVIPKT